MSEHLDLRKLLAWYVESGADEAIGAAAPNRYVARKEPPAPPAFAAAPPAVERPAAAKPEPQRPTAKPVPAAPLTPASPLPPPDAAMRDAKAVATACADLPALRAALEAFEGCALRYTATNLVFGDGQAGAPVMFIGEAPGADEDREGVPFVGAAGQLLNKMLSAAGLDRSGVYITNILPWRPPGNRTPTPNEVTVCLPFLRRHIELVNPKVLVLVGGTSAGTLLGTSDGINRLRGRWHLYRSSEGAKPIPARAVFHTAYLLRTPGRKREAWQDMLEIRRRMRDDASG